MEIFPKRGRDSSEPDIWRRNESDEGSFVRWHALTRWNNRKNSAHGSLTGRVFDEFVFQRIFFFTNFLIDEFTFSMKLHFDEFWKILLSRRIRHWKLLGKFGLPCATRATAKLSRTKFRVSRSPRLIRACSKSGGGAFDRSRVSPSGLGINTPGRCLARDKSKRAHVSFHVAKSRSKIKNLCFILFFGGGKLSAQRKKLSALESCARDLYFYYIFGSWSCL